jgi:hypothetical protein
MNHIKDFGDFFSQKIFQVHLPLSANFILDICPFFRNRFEENKTKHNSIAGLGYL